MSLAFKRAFKISQLDQPERDAVFLLQVCERSTVLYGRYMKGVG